MRAELVLVALLATGCAQDQGTLARLTQAYADQSAELMAVPLAATLLSGALAADLCTTVPSGAWHAYDPGDYVPMGLELYSYLGEPAVDGVRTTPTAVELALSEVAIGGSADRRIFLSAREGEPFAVSGAVVDASGELLIGTFTWMVAAECSYEWSRVSGQSTWYDADGNTHEVAVPSDTSAIAGLDYPGLDVWLPAEGALTWQARIQDSLRNFNSDDASELLLTPDGAEWSGAVSGVEWESEVTPRIPLDVD